jgi:hypothetical protein
LRQGQTAIHPRGRFSVEMGLASRGGTDEVRRVAAFDDVVPGGRSSAAMISLQLERPPTGFCPRPAAGGGQVERADRGDGGETLPDRGVVQAGFRS